MKEGNKMEKLNLRRADNLTTKDLVKTMSKNYEVYNIVFEEIIDMNVEYAIDYLENLKGVEFHSYIFGSVFNNDYEADIVNIDKFLNNNFDSDNETFYELLNSLRKDKKNDKLQKELLNMLFGELDSNTTLESYDLEEVVYYESDMFDNWLGNHEMAVDMSSYKLYNSYELEELGLDIDYQDLD